MKTIKLIEHYYKEIKKYYKRADTYDNYDYIEGVMDTYEDIIARLKNDEK